MATVTVEVTYQGYIFYQLTAASIDWVKQVRNNTTGSPFTITSNSSQSAAIYAGLVSSRSGFVGSCGRTFLFFDGLDTAIGGGTITSATLKIYGNGTTSSADTIIVEGSAWGGSGGTSTLASGDFDSLDHSTAYSAKDLSWAGGYNDFTMNATAISDMNTNGYLNAVLIEGDYDYDSQSPSVGTITSAGVEFLDPTNPIKLELTYTPAGYGNDIIGVSAANIDSVIGVATADIDNIIGV